MTNEQKEQAQSGIRYALEHIQEIEARTDDSLALKVDSVQHQLVMMLEDIIEVLPKSMKPQAEMCRNRYQRLRDAWYAEGNAWWAQQKAQKETRSESLATTNELL